MCGFVECSRSAPARFGRPLTAAPLCGHPTDIASRPSSVRQAHTSRRRARAALGRAARPSPMPTPPWPAAESCLHQCHLWAPADHPPRLLDSCLPLPQAAAPGQPAPTCPCTLCITPSCPQCRPPLTTHRPLAFPHRLSYLSLQQPVLDKLSSISLWPVAKASRIAPPVRVHPALGVWPPACRSPPPPCCLSAQILLRSRQVRRRCAEQLPAGLRTHPRPPIRWPRCVAIARVAPAGGAACRHRRRASNCQRGLALGRSLPHCTHARCRPTWHVTPCCMP